MKCLILICSLVIFMATFSQAFMGMPGGLNKVKNLKDVEPYTSLIEKHYNEQSKDNNYGIVAKIESAESQVVAGIRYVIKYTLSKTDCKKEDVMKGLKASNSCNKTTTIESCIADVIIRSWEKYVGVEGMKCNDIKTGFYKEEN